MKGLGLTVVATLLTCSSVATAQSLAETAAFIIEGGAVNLSDMKEKDDGTLSYKRLNIQATVQVIDKDHCVIQKTGTNEIIKSDVAVITYYFDNVIADESTIQGDTLHLVGADKVYCYKSATFNECQKTRDLSIATEPSRITKAIKYIYSNFCTPAKRGSAF